MARTVLLDSSALVAALRERDSEHEWARMSFHALTEPVITCDAVLSECFFLLAGWSRGKEMLCELLEDEIIKTDFQACENISHLARLIRRYADTPMSYADACLVRMSELFHDSTIFTMDRDFAIYRRNGRQIIPLIAPW